MSHQWLPHLLRELADAFGMDVALAFARRFGGGTLHIPREAKPEHAIARAAGIEVLRFLVDRYASDRVVVPLGPTSLMRVQMRRADELIAKGASLLEVARETGLHVRTVSRIKARQSVIRRQGDLFR